MHLSCRCKRYPNSRYSAHFLTLHVLPSNNLKLGILHFFLSDIFFCLYKQWFSHARLRIIVLEIITPVNYVFAPSKPSIIILNCSLSYSNILNRRTYFTYENKLKNRLIKPRYIFSILYISQQFS